MLLMLLGYAVRDPGGKPVMLATVSYRVQKKT